MYYRHGTVYQGVVDGHTKYRIPAVVLSASGTLLAFCEGREGTSDKGAIDIVLRRSSDEGVTWTDEVVVVDGLGNTAGNPAPVVDADTGDVLLLFCRNPADSAYPRTVFLTRSSDDGVTWDEPVEITSSVSCYFVLFNPLNFGIQSSQIFRISCCYHQIFRITCSYHQIFGINCYHQIFRICYQIFRICYQIFRISSCYDQVF